MACESKSTLEVWIAVDANISVHGAKLRDRAVVCKRGNVVFGVVKRPFLETEDAAERVEHHVVRKRFHCVFLERGDGLRVLFHEIVRHGKPQGNSGHVPSEMSRPVSELWILSVVGHINHDLKVGTCLESLIKLGKHPVVVPEGIVVGIRPVLLVPELVFRGVTIGVVGMTANEMDEDHSRLPVLGGKMLEEFSVISFPKPDVMIRVA